MGSSSSPSTAEHAKSSGEGSKHTPGPWTLQAGDATGFKTASGGASILASARPTDDYFILKVAEMDTNAPDAERVANAHLIAAAPEMYAALSEIGLLILTNRTAPLGEIVAICARVLDKAEGRS